MTVKSGGRIDYGGQLVKVAHVSSRQAPLVGIGVEPTVYRFEGSTTPNALFHMRDGWSDRFQIRHPLSSGSSRRGAPVLWRWGRVELPVQGLRADRVYERSRRFFVSRNEARTDTLPVLARSVYLSPPTDRSAGRSSAYIALPDPRSGDREDVSLTRQRERKKCWQLSACRSD